MKSKKTLAAARHGLVVMERSKVIMVVAGCVAALALALWIGQTEKGREWRDPVGFWKQKVDSEKRNVDRYKEEVRRCARDIGLATSAEGKRSF